jgi:twitching motility protein PilT
LDCNSLNLNNMDIKKLLKYAVDARASDLHLNANSHPIIRVDGALRTLNDEELITPQSLHDLFVSITNEKQQQTLLVKKQLDFAHIIPGVGRFRVNALIQREALSFAFRVIANEVTPLSSMGLPDIYSEITMARKGLILITGPTGSGKSTTLAAMVNYLNENESRHIITVEDPIEYIHPNKKSIILQLEVGRDTESFSQALWNTLRHDPDVLVVGEMRDLETISAAITAAETGHLVMGTLHTNDATQTIDRVIDVFPHGQQAQMRVQLSQVLLGVFSQVLLPCINGGRVPACEIMIANSAVRNSIREGKTQYLQNAIQLGVKEKMQTLNQALAKLVVEKDFTVQQAVHYSVDREQLMNLIGLKELVQRPVYA